MNHSPFTITLKLSFLSMNSKRITFHEILLIILLPCILSLGLFLRSFHLATNPLGFFCDEASVGYNAYMILTKGSDETGKPFPIFFQSFDDYKAPIAIYATVPFIAVLGLTETATRLPSVFFGFLTLIFLYLLAKETVGKEYALWTVFIAASMPWLIHYDRVAFLMNIYATFFTATIYLFIKSLHHKQFLIPFFIVAGLSLYTYQPPKLIIPLLLVSLFILFRSVFLRHTRESLIGLFLFIGISFPLLFSFMSGEATARFSKISIFTSEVKGSELVRKSASQYLFQFYPEYLSLNGEPTFITRHFTKGFTPLLLITFPFVVLGIFYLFRHHRTTFARILILWLFLYPLGASLVAEAPYSSRSIIGAPLFALIAAYGIIHAKQLFMYKKRSSLFLTGGIIVLYCINIFFFTRFYFTTYPRISADYWGWQYGPKQILRYFATVHAQYDTVYMTGYFNAPDIFLKFYDPQKKCKNCFIGGPDRYNPEKKQLFALRPDEIKDKKTFRVITTILYPDKTPAFVIGTFLSQPL